MRENLKFAPAEPTPGKTPAQARVTLINQFDTVPQNQDAVVRLLDDAVESCVRFFPGFISSTLHISLDGRRVVNYAEWESREAWAAMTRHPDVIARMSPILNLAKATAGAFETVSRHVV